jgi:hypothetical protein
MGKITFNRFDLGIDLRKGASVSDANRLREMKNAFVTTGLATQKRPGLVKVAMLEPGTKGMVAALGKLNTFYGEGAINHADARFKANKVKKNLAEAPVVDVPFADVFNGFIYAAVDYGTEIVHHYLDGTAESYIADINCPDTAAVLKLASKVFAVSQDGATVKYCKTGAPRDWTTANDAGFLPTGLNARGDRSTNALGVYQSKLVALARDGAQVWTVDPDPTKMALDDMVENVGSSFPRSLATVAGDLYFLSDFGFRSITTLQLVSKLADVDIGSPIDKLVRLKVRNLPAPPRSVYYYGSGQYMCFIGDEVFVYSVSRTAKVAAWSRYVMPFAIDAVAELQGVLYLRSGDNVYKFAEDVFTDDGAPYEAMLELPYMDFKLPGNLKQIYGADLVMDGECHFSIGFDVRDAAAVTDEVRVIGNTRGGGMIPIEICGTEFSLRFRNATSQPFQLDAVTIYFNDLGPT